MPNTEPNAMPPAFDSWEDWRGLYAQHVADFKATRKSASDVLQLKIRLRRMGYFGKRLEDEIEYIKND